MTSEDTLDPIESNPVTQNQTEEFVDVPYDPIRKVDRLYNKILGQFVSAVFSSEKDNGNSGSAITIDWTKGNKQKVTLSADATLTFTSPSGPCNLILKAVNFGAHTPTFSPSIKWPAGTTPTFTASGTDIIALYYDGSSYYGQASLNFS